MTFMLLSRPTPADVFDPARIDADFWLGAEAMVAPQCFAQLSRQDACDDAEGDVDPDWRVL